MENSVAKAPGNTMLKVVGILFIIFSSLNLILALLALAGAALLYETGAMGHDAFGIEHTAGEIALAAVVMLAQNLFGLFMGIMSLVFASKAHKGSLIRVLAVISLIFVALMIVFDPSVFSFLGIVLPVLCLIGAHRNAASHKVFMEFGHRDFEQGPGSF